MPLGMLRAAALGPCAGWAYLGRCHPVAATSSCSQVCPQSPPSPLPHWVPGPPPVQKLYEAKSYKKAVKEADKVLKAHPNHGGTTAMKALCTYLLAKKDEAITLAKAAVSYDIRCVHCGPRAK